MIQKFPFKDEVLRHATVCNVNNIRNASFKSIRFFIEQFSVFLDENFVSDIDKLQTEFCSLQLFNIPADIAAEEKTDIQWHNISKIKNNIGEYPYEKIAKVMLGILCIPHSNAECERIFSAIKKIIQSSGLHFRTVLWRICYWLSIISQENVSNKHLILHFY